MARMDATLSSRLILSTASRYIPYPFTTTVTLKHSTTISIIAATHLIPVRTFILSPAFSSESYMLESSYLIYVS